MSARRIPVLALAIMLLVSLAPLALAQPGRPGQPFQPRQPGPVGPFGPNRPSSQGDAEAAAGCAGCAAFGVFGVFMLVLVVGSTVVWILVAIWAARDASARGMDNSALWVVLILFTGLIGLIIYLVTRPQGELVLCEECGSKRLRESRRCPHCRAA
jgi:hypothetical protein